MKTYQEFQELNLQFKRETVGLTEKGDLVMLFLLIREMC